MDATIGLQDFVCLRDFTKSIFWLLHMRGCAKILAWEGDLEEEDLLGLKDHLKGARVDADGLLDGLDVHVGVEAALGENVEEHVDELGIEAELVVAPDEHAPRDGVPAHVRDEAILDVVEGKLEEGRLVDEVRVEAADELLARILADLRSERDVLQEIVRRVVELERALILEFLEDRVADLLDRPMGDSVRGLCVWLCAEWFTARRR